MGVIIMQQYSLISDDYLMHHGVKGMKWGVRRNLQVEGYRRASHFTEKRDIKALKAKERSGQISKATYKSQKAAVQHKQAALRGKKLVENNQTYGKIAVKSIAKTAAVGAGTAAVAGLAVGAGAAYAVPMAVGLGGAMAVSSIRNDRGRIRDIKAYRR